MSFQPLKRILPKAMEQKGISQQILAVRVLEKAQEILERVWGRERSELVRPKSYSRQVLKLATSVPAAAQMIRVEAILLQNELNRAFGEKIIKEIRCELE